MGNEVGIAKARPWLRYASIALSVGAIAVFLVGAAVPNKGAWTCDDKMFLHGDGEGDKTEQEALDRAALIVTNLAPAFPGSKEEAETAVNSATGPDRYDAEAGILYIDDYIAATFEVGQSPDGTYSVGTITTCAPQGQGESGPTPSGQGA